MPVECRQRLAEGLESCIERCGALAQPPVFSRAWCAAPSDLPAPADDTIDVAVLDLHHGWPNLGHDAIVAAVQGLACDLRAPLVAAGLRVRTVSYDVRRGHHVPEPPGGRHAIYVGTGGPGHIDPRLNDGRDEGSQGIAEDPSWEPRVFALFDAILADDEAVLLGICHTFGVMCRWLGVADAVLRTEAKGGKSTGIVWNQLLPEALAHPWFGRLARWLGPDARFPVLDNRLYDLIARPGVTAPVTWIAHEVLPSGVVGESVTTMELARDRSGRVPRVLGVNHHPEVANRATQLAVLERKRLRGEVSEAWYEERRRTLTEPLADSQGERALLLSASYAFHGVLRHALLRVLGQRAAALGRTWTIDEETAAVLYDPDADALGGTVAQGEKPL